MTFHKKNEENKAKRLSFYVSLANGPFYILLKDLINCIEFYIRKEKNIQHIMEKHLA